MSIKEVAQRFVDEYRTLRTDCEISYPILLPGEELLFVYETEKIDDSHFRIASIDHIVKRDIRTEKLTRYAPEDLLSTDDLKDIISRPVIYKNYNTDDDPFYRYHASYDRTLKIFYKSHPNAEETVLINEYLKELIEVAGDGGLRLLYRILGRTLFDYCEAMVGVRTSRV